MQSNPEAMFDPECPWELCDRKLRESMDANVAFVIYGEMAPSERSLQAA